MSYGYQKEEHRKAVLFFLVDLKGFEPTTLRMRTVRSPKCDIARARIFVHSNLFKIGLGGMRIIRLPQEMRMIRGELPNHSHLFY